MSAWATRWYRPRPGLLLLLVPLAWAYGVGVRLWHGLFDLGLRRPVRVAGARVISVGNLVVGGAGKTPVVIELARRALGAGHLVAVLSRGYGRASGAVRSFSAAALPPVVEVGDEPRLIARRCPGVTVWVGPDRVALARRAVAAGATVLLLDDGFQHRRLARDEDVLVDGGAGNGWLLPVGPLREPSSARRRATLIWGRDGQPGDVEARHALRRVRGPDGREEPAEVLRGQRVVALSAIARPDRFAAALRALGAEVVAERAFGDHHVFSARELAAVTQLASRHGARVVTTEKDAERLPDGLDAWVAVLEVEVLRGEERLARLIAGP